MDQQEAIDKCYSLEDDAVALDCMKETVREAKGDCKPQLVLLTQESCTPCVEEKALHKDALKEGVIKELSVDTDAGMKVAIKNEIDFFPAIVLLDCDEKVIYPTEIPE